MREFAPVSVVRSDRGMARPNIDKPANEGIREGAAVAAYLKPDRVRKARSGSDIEMVELWQVERWLRSPSLLAPIFRRFVPLGGQECPVRQAICTFRPKGLICGQPDRSD